MSLANPRVSALALGLVLALAAASGAALAADSPSMAAARNAGIETVYPVHAVRPHQPYRCHIDSPSAHIGERLRGCPQPVE